MNTKRLSLLSLLFIIGILVIVILNYSHKSTAGDIYKMNETNASKNINTGFGMKMTPGNYKDVYYQINGNNFIGKFIIDNRSAQPYEYGILLLKDFKQTDFVIDKTKITQPGYLLIKLNPFEKKEIEFQTFIPDGKHSLTSVVIWEPNKYNNKDGPINDIINYKRITVIANNNTPEKILHYLNSKSKISVKSKILANDEIEFVKRKEEIKYNEIKLWLFDSVLKEDKTIFFNIALSNVPLSENDISQKDVAIIGLLNGKQVPLKIDNQKKLVHYGKLNAKEQVVIGAEMEMPKQNISNFYLLLINRPFEEFTFNGNNYDEYYLKYSLSYSKRVTLIKS